MTTNSRPEAVALPSVCRPGGFRPGIICVSWKGTETWSRFGSYNFLRPSCLVIYYTPLLASRYSPICRDPARFFSTAARRGELADVFTTSCIPIALSAYCVQLSSPQLACPGTCTSHLSYLASGRPSPPVRGFCATLWSCSGGYCR